MNKKENPRDKLLNIDLISMMKDNSTEDIAKKYGVSIHIILNLIGEQFKKRSIGFYDYKNQNELSEDELECTGAWTKWENRINNLELLKALRPKKT